LLKTLNIKEISLPKKRSSQDIGFDIKRITFSGPSISVSKEVLLGELKENTVENSEWHHKFYNRKTKTSSYSFRVNLKSKKSDRRTLTGKMDIKWKFPGSSKQRISRVSIVEMTMVTSRKKDQFREVETISNTQSLMPILTYDLNYDGAPEIILPSINRVYLNSGKGKFKGFQLSTSEQKLKVAGGLIADFSNDGKADLILTYFDGPVKLFKGKDGGLFESKGKVISPAGFKLQKPIVLSAGDFDSDGDLDLFIGQYKPPYERGQMPTPYYDANDGYPSYLMENRKSKLIDISSRIKGFQKLRRVYAASFVDINNDEKLDLLVTSDFSGVDYYKNTKDYTFVNATEERFKGSKLFGMSHLVFDFDHDEKMDFLFVGMSSTTAERLEYYNLGLTSHKGHQKNRMKMAFGNRFYTNKEVVQKELNKTGWAWGATALDINNDSFKDLFIGNGHFSGKVSQDYCTTFWRQDIYQSSSKESFAFDRLFQEKTKFFDNGDKSWNPFETNRLFLNQSGKRFFEVAQQFNLAKNFDARSVLSMDFDKSGTEDLLVLEYKGLEKGREVLHLYSNQAEAKNNWISHGKRNRALSA